MITKTNIFIGPEVEGSDRGEQTLFFPRGILQPSQIDKLLSFASHNNIKRFYFGAGSETGISDTDFILIMLLVQKNQKVLLEIQKSDCDYNSVFSLCYFLNKEVFEKVEIIFVIVDNDLPSFLINHVKFLNTERLTWFKVKQSYTNKTNDPLYKQDKIVLL